MDGRATLGRVFLRARPTRFAPALVPHLA